jgi:hypothetical protein
MAGLDPAIQAVRVPDWSKRFGWISKMLLFSYGRRNSSWTRFSSPLGVDGRVKPGHDDRRNAPVRSIRLSFARRRPRVGSEMVPQGLEKIDSVPGNGMAPIAIDPQHLAPRAAPFSAGSRRPGSPVPSTNTAPDAGRADCRASLSPASTPGFSIRKTGAG